MCRIYVHSDVPHLGLLFFLSSYNKFLLAPESDMKILGTVLGVFVCHILTAVTSMPILEEKKQATITSAEADEGEKITRTFWYKPMKF
jgi:hypothetical protein